MIAEPFTRAPETRGFAPYQTILFAITALVLFAGGPILLQALYFAGAYDGNATSMREFAAWFATFSVGNAAPFYAQGVGGVPLIIFLLQGLPRLGERSLRDFGFREPTPREIGIGVAAGFGAQIAAALVGALQQQVTHAQTSQDVAKLLGQLHGFDIYAASFFAVVLGPFIEELLMRAFIYRALRRYMRVPLAILISGLIFGAAHMQPLFILPLAATGFVLAACYEATGCFWVNYLCHFTNNLVAMIAFFVFHLR